MAGRSLPRLVATTTAALASRLRVLPAASHLISSTTTSASSSSEPCSDGFFARVQNPISLRVSSFPVSDGGVRCFTSISSGGWNTERLGLQILLGEEIQSKCFSTKVIPPASDDTVATEEAKPKTLDDFQHEEITGPTVERDLSPVADELRESLDILQRRILSFQKSLIALGCVQGVGAVWCHVSWQSLNPTWQLLPSALLSFAMAFVLRQALQPISFFGKLEERSRLRIITLSLMISKGFASFFNRARILVAASILGLLCVLLYNPSTYMLGLFGILK